MATVSLSGLKKTYPNGYAAVHGIDIEISDGEFVVLVGPSGCGKSTLLRMIAGLETISEGELQINARTMNALEPGARDIAMVFQNYALYPHMTVYNNMAYGLKNRKFSKNDIAIKVAECAKILELGHLLDRRPTQLSGGQRQRVAMGRAIVRDPQVFLFDEPLSNLDAKLRVQMRLEIKKLQKRLGTTAIYVTHDQVEAMTMADRLVVLRDGNVEQIGTPLEIYHSPQSQFVGEFIGSPPMNFLQTQACEHGLRLQDGRPSIGPVTSTPEAPVNLGIRPENMHICAEHEADVILRADMVEVLGADTLVHCQSTCKTHEVILRLKGYQQIEQNTVIPVRIDRSHALFFSSSTGKRLTLEKLSKDISSCLSA